MKLNEQSSLKRSVHENEESSDNFISKKPKVDESDYSGDDSTLEEFLNEIEDRSKASRAEVIAGMKHLER